MDLSKYTRSSKEGGSSGNPDVGRFYGEKRNDQGLYMLEFRLKGGDCFAIPYSGINGMLFHPSGGIVIEYADQRFLLQGKNLAPLWEKLLGRGVAWIREVGNEAREEAETCVYEVTSMGSEERE